MSLPNSGQSQPLLERYLRLIDISRDLSSTLDLDRLLYKIVKAAADLTDSLRCEIYADLGLGYLSLRNCKSSVPILLKAEKCKPDEISVLLNIASSYQLCNKIDDANNYYRKVLAIDPNNKAATVGEMQTRVQGRE